MLNEADNEELPEIKLVPGEIGEEGAEEGFTKKEESVLISVKF